MEKRRIIVNIICSLLLQVVTIVSGFILPKIIISSLGSETNGLVASINQFLNYVGRWGKRRNYCIIISTIKYE